MAAKQKKTAAVVRPLFERIRGILESARVNVARTVDTTQVMANWLIGREIVEEEQRGKKRADYGRKALADLSARLGREYGRGYSVDNLEAFRQFYLEYPRLISETTSRSSIFPSIPETASRKFIGTKSVGPSQPGTLNPNLYIAVLPTGEVTVDFHPFTLDVAGLHLQPADRELIIQHLRRWNYCYVLRDDGRSYGDYVKRLTCLLPFVKITGDCAKSLYNRKNPVSEKYSYQCLIKKDGDKLLN